MLRGSWVLQFGFQVVAGQLYRLGPRAKYEPWLQEPLLKHAGAEFS